VQTENEVSGARDDLQRNRFEIAVSFQKKIY